MPSSNTEPREGVMERYGRLYGEIRQLYEDDELEKAVEQAEDLLDDSALPRYYRMRLLMLIAGAADDWMHADRLLVWADTLWRMTRAATPVGSHPAVEQALQDVRTEVDSLRAQGVGRPSQEDMEEYLMEDLEGAMKEARLEREELADEEMEGAFEEARLEREHFWDEEAGVDKAEIENAAGVEAGGKNEDVKAEVAEGQAE